MDTRDPELRKELDALLQTRGELGEEYEAELVESFLEKLDEGVERRVRRQLAEHRVGVASDGGPPGARGSGFGGRVAVTVSSLVLAVPLSAIAVVNADLPGLLICWTGIVGVNAAHASRTWFGGGRDRRDA